MRIIFFVVATILSCLLANDSYGQELMLLENGEENIVINSHAYILKNKSPLIGEISNVVAMPDSAFRKNTYFQEVHYGFHQSAGWCKFTVKNNSDHTDWILKVHQSRVDTLQLYVQRQNGELEKYPITGHFQTIKERGIHAISFGHRISIAKNETVVFYLYSMRKFARHAAVVALLHEDYFMDYNTRYVILMSALDGICILAIVIGIVLYAFLREQVYIYYSLYCLSFLMLIVIDTGFLYAFIGGGPFLKLVNNLSIVVYYLVAGSHTLFTIELLKLKSYQHRWLYKLGVGSGTLFCFLALVLLLPIPEAVRRQISIWSYYIIFYLDAYIFYAMFTQLIRKEVAVYFYMAGFLFTVLSASVLAMADLQLIGRVNQNTDWFFAAPVVEIVCMVIGLGVNSATYVRDRLRAQRQIITVQEDERKRIAQDLHDDAGNSLAAVKNMLSQRKDPALIEKEIDEIIQNIRNISHDLMPVDFKQYELPDIIRHTVNKFKDHRDINFDYHQTGTASKLHPVVELMIYRIINELITNSIRHSKATNVMIQLLYQSSSLVVMVEDNGIGMKTTAETKKGIGLKNIQHRAAYINATFTIESDNKGSLVIIEIPYEKK